MNKKQSKFTRAVPVYARLDPVTDKQLESYAENAGVSKSLAVSMAVRYFLENDRQRVFAQELKAIGAYPAPETAGGS